MLHQFCLGHHRGVSRYLGTHSFPAVDAHTEHRVLSLPLDDRPNVPPPPDPKPVIWLVSMLFRLYRRLSHATLTLLTVRTPPPSDSTLGTLSQDRSPRSESKRPVERPSSCDISHNARLATKGLVQQSPVNRPVYSEHVPVTPGPSKPGTGPMTGTRYRDPVLGARFHRPHRVNWVQWPHRVHRSHRVQRSHRSNRSDRSTLVRNLNWKRPTSAWPSLSFLFFFHRTDRCN